MCECSAISKKETGQVNEEYLRQVPMRQWERNVALVKVPMLIIPRSKISTSQRVVLLWLLGTSQCMKLQQKRTKIKLFLGKSAEFKKHQIECCFQANLPNFPAIQYDPLPLVSPHQTPWSYYENHNIVCAASECFIPDLTGPEVQIHPRL